MKTLLPRSTPALSTAALVGAALGLATTVGAQTGRVVTPAETVEAVQADGPTAGNNSVNVGSASRGGSETPAAEEPQGEAGELAVLRGKVAALETRVAQLEEAFRKMGGTDSGRLEGSESGMPEADAPPTEQEIQQAREQRQAEAAETADAREELHEKQDERRAEVQEQIRNRINNARLDDNDGGIVTLPDP
ncbi:hypothetical protein [Phycisphaera mikurensis]|uniref:Uncharacterized protein n=1 Tax=Phycisphaera mikurensis (strain NBRC 102666 / KCTC 22515 / FYK2301M01) TaxID=1142394 RepID=I0IHD6_PHYMF|nr:hypothetical protein [Phycisphaera mikurensis]MBB6440923.1 TolA-binding protein [Phycisphaera mikurensis]BAM04674.1 hypothetical protein PSMK_25150 [Phycisphaera mikurensis NBRC 102666]